MIPFKEIKSIVFSLNKSTLRHVLGKQRLRLSKDEITLYIHSIFKQNDLSIHFKCIYKKLYKRKLISIKYNTFMYHVQQCAKLFRLIFNKCNRLWCINKTRDFNIIDSTLLPTKDDSNIIKRDFLKNKVTVRKNKLTCGFKGLFLMNSKKQFYYASLLDINISDANILKDSAYYEPLLAGKLLADRGFSNKTVRKRINDISGVTLVSPYHYKIVEKTKLFLEDEYKDLYKLRWWIETGFQYLKSKRGKYKLDLSGNFSKNILNAKFLISIIIYNYDKR